MLTPFDNICLPFQAYDSFQKVDEELRVAKEEIKNLKMREESLKNFISRQDEEIARLGQKLEEANNNLADCEKVNASPQNCSRFHWFFLVLFYAFFIQWSIQWGLEFRTFEYRIHSKTNVSKFGFRKANAAILVFLPFENRTFYHSKTELFKMAALA